ncbi:hypothetical protein H6F93_31955 [Leptolyngbya sp. FACHB-671]|uniref:hypothetical protein n=1 Tax=Leptolyngbya sp. FACHB-671 TaxID=2692812 RepID=UPI001681CADD|nr:hypothetical protein [Leptolyngbya sp. FACHB-671]MBD2072084.1 hypothetical protein [Leptolyngbya sp. FACHB-671]
MNQQLKLAAALFLRNLNSQAPIELVFAALLALAIFPAMVIGSIFLLMFGLAKLFRGLIND